MGKKYLNIYRNSDRNDALNKPKKDINTILAELSFTAIDQPIFNDRYSKLFKAKSAVEKITKQLEKNDILIIQYPTYMGGWFDHLLANHLKKNKVKTILIIHDIDSLRFEVPKYKNLSHEIKLLNKFDVVISPNSSMSTMLKKNGLTVVTEEIQIFDYLTNVEKKERVSYSKTVSFMGNLNKSLFINKLKFIKGLDIKLFGPLSDGKNLSNYVGSFESDELIRKINSGFGLVWDGPSISKIDEKNVSTGSYLKFNNPYKLSFYVTIGIPILIWKDAAEADFVEREGIGILINSLEDIPELLDDLSVQKYEKMLAKVDKIRERLISGFYTSTVVQNALFEEGKV